MFTDVTEKVEAPAVIPFRKKVCGSGQKRTTRSASSATSDQRTPSSHQFPPELELVAVTLGGVATGENFSVQLTFTNKKYAALCPYLLPNGISKLNSFRF